MAEREEALAKLDESASEAAKELEQILVEHQEGVQALAEWWKKYYGSAGHKRLGRLLIAIT